MNQDLQHSSKESNVSLTTHKTRSVYQNNQETLSYEPKFIQRFAALIAMGVSDQLFQGGNMCTAQKDAQHELSDCRHKLGTRKT